MQVFVDKFKRSEGYTRVKGRNPVLQEERHDPCSQGLGQSFADQVLEEVAACPFKDSIKSPLSFIIGIVEIRRTHTYATQNVKQNTIHYQNSVCFRTVATGITFP